MACLQTLNGLGSACEFSAGGIKKIYAINYSDVKSITTNDDGEISVIALVSDEKKFKAYNFKKNTASLETEATIEPTTGTHFYTNTLNLVFTRQDTAKRLELQAMALAEMAIIVLDSNGNYIYLGQDEPVTATAHSASTGTAKADGNNYTLTLVDESVEMPRFLAEDLLIETITEEVA